MRAHKRVDRQNTDGDNDHRGEDTDDFHDAIKIKEGSDDNQNCADRTSRPCRDSKLLFQVRSRAREHDDAHREARKNQNNVDNATNQRRGDAFKDFVVVA